MVIEKAEIKYYNNNENDGMIIDWDDVFKIYNSLGCPPEVYNPSEAPINDAEWFVLTSERSTGKTSNLVLIAMILFLRFGCITAYLRQKSDQVTPKEMKNFMNVILQFKYIDKLTNGEYNGVRYWSRRYTFVKWDETDQKVKESEPFIWVGDVQEELTYRSNLNLPTCVLIIYDEFISTEYMTNEIVTLCQLHKTIARDRFGVKMFMCANTTNYYHEYFRELLIQDEVLNCKVNHDFIKFTPLGTKIYYKMIGNRSIKREQLNTKYYGFNNPRLKSITGGDWSINNYPHIEKEERKVIYNHLYFLFNERYYQIELVHSERLGIHCIIHRCNHPLKRKYDPRVYTIEEIKDKNQIYKFGSLHIYKYIWELRKKNKWYYADNDVGFTAESYVNRANKL